MENSNVPNGRQNEAEAAGGSSTITIVEESSHTDDQNDHFGLPILKLRLQKPKNDKKVQWTETTVDNEDLNRRKSKSRKFDESSSSEDDNDDCKNCRGHVEMKKTKHKPDETLPAQDEQSTPIPSQLKPESQNQQPPLPPSS